jgi:hypothetical protein
MPTLTNQNTSSISDRYCFILDSRLAYESFKMFMFVCDRQIAKYVVALGDKVSPTDIEEGMRVGYVICISNLIL